MRACFFGDSFVNGTGDDAGLGWCGRLAARARRSGVDLTYYNLGVRLETSDDIAARWRDEAQRRLPQGCNPRLAFSFGTNDCATDDNGRTRTPRARSLANAEIMLRSAAAIGPTLMIGPPPDLVDAAAESRLRRLSEDFAALCRTIGVPFLETLTFVQACEAWRREAEASDGTHPNEVGYSALADHVAVWPAYRAWLVVDGTRSQSSLEAAREEESNDSAEPRRAVAAFDGDQFVRNHRSAIEPRSDD